MFHLCASTHYIFKCKKTSKVKLTTNKTDINSMHFWELHNAEEELKTTTCYGIRLFLVLNIQLIAFTFLPKSWLLTSLYYVDTWTQNVYRNKAYRSYYIKAFKEPGCWKAGIEKNSYWCPKNVGKFVVFKDPPITWHLLSSLPYLLLLRQPLYTWMNYIVSLGLYVLWFLLKYKMNRMNLKLMEALFVFLIWWSLWTHAFK